MTEEQRLHCSVEESNPCVDADVSGPKRSCVGGITSRRQSQYNSRVPRAKLVIPPRIPLCKLDL